MKRKIPEGMVQSAVWLSQDLHQRLKQAGGERGMGEQIRQRLQASFDASANPKTQELLDAISVAADETEGYYGNWAEDAFAFEVLRACVDLLLAERRPKGDAVPKHNRDEVAEIFFGPDHSPKDISRTIVSSIRSAAQRARQKR
jgi:hypothetical protein